MASWSQICAIMSNTQSHLIIWQAYCSLDNGPLTGIFLSPHQCTSGGNATIMASPPPTTTATTPSHHAPTPAVAPHPLSSMLSLYPNHKCAILHPTSNTSLSKNSSNSINSAKDLLIVRYFPII